MGYGRSLSSIVVALVGGGGFIFLTWTAKKRSVLRALGCWHLDREVTEASSGEADEQANATADCRSRNGDI